MKKNIRFAIDELKKFFTELKKLISDSIRSDGKWKKVKAISGKYGYYFGLFALLAALGAASNAYRNRSSDLTDAPIAERPVRVSAVITPAPSPEITDEEDFRTIEYTWPVEGNIITAFSPDTLAWNATLKHWQNHPGIDICADPGQAVVACSDGEVKDAYSDPIWGNVIIIAHEDGAESIYANLNTLNLVTVGQDVKGGEAISSIGKSAAAEAEMPWHLHFEFKNAQGEHEDFSQYVN